MNLFERFYRCFIVDSRYKLIIQGIGNTFVIAILACLIGGAIGLGICYLRTSKNKVLSTIAKVYIKFFRGIPIVLLLMLTYYVFLAKFNISDILVAVLALSLYNSAYVAEIFRSGFLAVKSEQIEASKAMGFTKKQTFIYVILPQAIRVIFPVYKSEFMTLIKLTSIVGYIGVRDLTRAIDIIRNQTFDAFVPLGMATILYFIIIGILTLVLNQIEKLINPKKV